MSRVLAFALLLFPTHALADTWMPPKVETTASADGATRVTITPRALEGALPYFRDKVDGREPAGQAPGSAARRPMARVERRHGGSWQVAWEGPLVNDVSPLGALITNDANRLVTFDNWHATGFGDDAVVIYDARGRLLRKFALTDLVPETYVEALPHSVSSIWWSGEHRIDDDGRTLVLAMVVPGPDAHPMQALKTIDVRVRLADGAVIPPSGPAWDAARKSAASVRAERERAEKERRAKLEAPLPPPTSADPAAWHEFAREVAVRKYDGTGMPRMFVLEPSGNRALFVEAARRGLREAGTDMLLFASTDPAMLADLVIREVEALDPGELSQARIVFIGMAAQREEVRRAVERAGGKFEFVDMTQPVAGVRAIAP